MSTSLVHLLTIVGTASQEVEAACNEMLGRRIERAPNEFGSDDWSERDHKDLEEFCVHLLDGAHELPVLYYAQYLDAWSVADSRYCCLLEWPDGIRRQVYGSSYGLAFYPSCHCDALLAQIKKMRRTKAFRTQTEDRWYLEHLKAATEAALWLQAPFLVVSISQCLGPSRDDDEIEAALDKPIGRARRCT
ncbi:MAG: hypothetical protein ACLQNE_41230 [Thermoguttaceae bacterium]|jgi:hypothetical protein